MEIADFLETYDAIEKNVMEGKLYTDAKSSIESALTKSSMSDEKRALLLQQFTTQIALGFPQMFLSQALAFYNLKSELELKTANTELIGLQQLEREASIRKQLGYKAENGSLEDMGDSLIDKQIEGFKKDMFYKIYKGGLENSSMLAQNDIATPIWLVNAIKASLDEMSEGDIAPELTEETDEV